MGYIKGEGDEPRPIIEAKWDPDQRELSVKEHDEFESWSWGSAEYLR
jgi:hypothetical protein